MKWAVIVTWAVTLGGSAAAFLPNLVAWLSRTLRAARRIEEYTGEILVATEGIAANTGNLAAMKDTLAAAPGLLDEADSIERQTQEIAAALSGSQPASAGEGREGTQ